LRDRSMMEGARDRQRGREGKREREERWKEDGRQRKERERAIVILHTEQRGADGGRRPGTEVGGEIGERSRRYQDRDWRMLFF